MIQTFKRPERTISTLIAAAFVMVAQSAPVSAQQAAVVDLKVSKIVARSVAGKGQASHDWLAKRDANTKERITVSSASLGTGSWICSPAGFGKKSRCYAR